MSDQGEKILVVDDNEMNTNLLEMELTDHNYRVLKASNGLDAISIANEEIPDLILLDIQMPGIDGLETLRRLRADVKTKEVPVILLTGLNDPRSIESGFSAGADEYLAKPILYDELAVRVNTILRMSRAEKELRKVKDEFNYLMVQDFLNHVAAIKGTLDVLAEEHLGQLNEAQKEIVSIATTAIDEHLNLIKELGDLAQLKSGRIHLQKEFLAVPEILESVLVSVRPLSRLKKVNLQTKIEGSLPQVAVDEKKTRQVLTNLLINAINFTQEGETVGVALSQVDRYDAAAGAMRPFIQVSVSDRGPSLSQEEINLALDAYEQAKQWKVSKYKGLGLTICKTVIEAHNGAFWAEALEGKGNTFNLVLPA
jgi:two-component system sensor histidine kinase/response regulator